MEDGLVGRMLLSVVAVVEEVPGNKFAVVPIQHHSVEVNPARDQTVELLPVMNTIAQVCSNVTCICVFKCLIYCIMLYLSNFN